MARRSARRFETLLQKRKRKNATDQKFDEEAEAVMELQTYLPIHLTGADKHACNHLVDGNLQQSNAMNHGREQE